MVEPIPCPRCGGQVEVSPFEGGRGTGELTSYSADCDRCGRLSNYFGDNGRLDNAIRGYNRWARSEANRTPKTNSDTP